MGLVLETASRSIGEEEQVKTRASYDIVGTSAFTLSAVGGPF